MACREASTGNCCEICQCITSLRYGCTLALSLAQFPRRCGTRKLAPIDKFIDVADLPILQDNGNVSAEFAKEFAETEFEKYRVIQDQLFQSDFDRFSDGNSPPLDID
jgi:hypothetical protein